MKRAVGTFSVTMKPESQDKVGDLTFGRYSITKTFSGGLEASSTLEMLAAGSEAGSGAYVAIERVEGVLDGLAGGFVLTHRGFRTAQTQSLEVTIVPGCGTGELARIIGTMTIRIENGDHFYELEYAAP